MSWINKAIKKILPTRVLESYYDLIAYQRSGKRGAKYLKHKEPIRVVFLLYYPAAWESFSSVYKYMESDERFELLVLAIPKVAMGSKYNEEIDCADTSCEDFCKNIGLNYKNAWSVEKDAWVSLQSIQPDYVFYARPYEEHYPKGFRAHEVSQYARTCYIPYGYAVQSGRILHTTYNRTFLSNITLCFFANKSAIEESIRSRPLLHVLNKRRWEYLGFPGFDGLFDDSKLCGISKVPYKHVVAWFPRWTVDDTTNTPSHFFDYCDDFLDFAKSRGDIQLIIRPHPLMFSNFITEGLMTSEDVIEFETRCVQLGNVHLDNDSNCYTSALSSDVIISDFTSLMMSFLVMNKPVISCDEKNQPYTPEGMLMDSAFYHERDWAAISFRINQLLDGHDDLATKRHEVLLQLGHDGNAGIRIAERLVDDFRNGSIR